MNMNSLAVPETILFDFQDPTNSPAWQTLNDDVMGGVSTSRFEIRANGSAVFTGAVSLDYNGGFASVRSTPIWHKLDGLDTFVLHVRGDGRRYKFTARTQTGVNAPLYQRGFVTRRGAWEEHRLAFADFVPTFRGRKLEDVPPLSPSHVASVGFLIADHQEGPFQLEISWAKAVLSTV